VIKQAVETKANVVTQDEKEHGLRAALNYGHTFGHVIENETKYKEFLHGEAVAIGIVMANEMALKMNFMSDKEALRVKKLLQKYNLPTEYEIANVKAFYEAFFLDKKSSDAAITFILPLGIGEVVITDKIDTGTIMCTLNKFGKDR
ncbi:MAG: 3-dehydroquinate synthase, partial [Sulfurimonas sp.]|nr:3-dehydroquinate synthase [Sulfurimonas sp.]